MRSCNHFYRGKEIIIKYSECVFAALFIEHAIRMRRILLSSLVCLAVRHFPTFSHKGHDFRKKVAAHRMRVLIFSTTFIRNISHFKKDSARYCHKCTNRASHKVPFIIVRFWSKLNVLEEFLGKSLNINFLKTPFSGRLSVPRGRTEGRILSQTDGQTDMTKLIVAFYNFAGAPKMKKWKIAIKYWIRPNGLI